MEGPPHRLVPEPSAVPLCVAFISQPPSTGPDSSFTLTSKLLPEAFSGTPRPRGELCPGCPLPRATSPGLPPGTPTSCPCSWSSGAAVLERPVPPPCLRQSQRQVTKARPVHFSGLPRRETCLLRLLVAHEGPTQMRTRIVISEYFSSTNGDSWTPPLSL